MNAKTIQNAEKLWKSLAGERARTLAKSQLASRVRSTGFEATLRWLTSNPSPNDGKRALAEALCQILNIPFDENLRKNRSKEEQLADNRSALALVEALHIYARKE